jgi:hypothetical protein
VNPTIYTPGELEKRVADGNSFIIRVLDQPKLCILGTEDELAEIAKESLLRLS